jgi:folate-dependent tRNA-U54 methylase TrmFO/GidA
MNQIQRNNKLNDCFGFLKGRAQKIRRRVMNEEKELSTPNKSLIGHMPHLITEGTSRQFKCWHKKWCLVA